VRPKQTHRTARSRCTLFSLGIFAPGIDRRCTRSRTILSFRQLESRAGSRSTLPVSSPTTCDRLPKKPECQSRTDKKFGLHNLRHSLSNWLVNKAKVEPKTVQGILRHAKIQTTLDLYTQEDSDETRAAQGQFLTAVGMNAKVQ
jgi:integrase